MTAAAEAPATHARALHGIADSLHADERRVVAQVEGSVTTGVVHNPRAAARIAGDLALAGQYAVGCLKMFGRAVNTHNDTVASLNTRYAQAVAAARADPDRVDGDGSVASASMKARGSLQGEYQRSLHQLDGDAEDVAGMLRSGVGARNVLSLTIAGLIPMDASTGYGRLQAQMNDLLGEWFGAEFANIFGNDDDFPLISLATAAGKMWRMSRGIAPIFQTGIVGRTLLGKMSTLSGPAGDFARWMAGAPRHMVPPRGFLPSPSWVARGGGGAAGWGPLSSGGKIFGMGAMRTLGVAGGIYNTATGIHGLIQQGNPVDAFKREGAGYVADVAETAFSASSTAFLVAPNPVTAGLAVGTGLVWAGAEVVDHWDDISDTASDAWDGAKHVAGDVGGTVKGWFS